jgi:hypothetical protein
MMKQLFAILAGAALMIASGSARAQDRQIRLGVGVNGPISAATENDIENLVGTLPNVKEVPIQPPGDMAACVKRFVAGEADDHLDGVIIVSLPAESFHTEKTENEARFTGTYEIWTLNLTTLAEDRHRFTFTDSEPIVGTAAAILSMPAQLFVERATGKKLLSSSAWQAYEAVEARVEAKLLAATKLYLQNASIRDTGPLNPIETAQQLIDRGDGDTAMAVFKSIGMANPEVQRMIAAAQAQLKRAESQNLLGRTLGAMEGGDIGEARTILTQYQSNPTAQASRASSISMALATPPDDHRAARAYDRELSSDVPDLDHAALLAMVKQMFAEETGSTPGEIIVTGKDMTISDKAAPAGLKTNLEAYVSALGKSARVMSLKCGCDASATLTSSMVGEALLRARFAPNSIRPEVGLP